MTFGQAIKQLLYINGIKMGVLANVLGYDISYLSKWTNDAKLPSPKSAELLCDKIAVYVSSVSTQASRAETAAKLGLEMRGEGSFAADLADGLYSIYLEQKNPAPEQEASDCNSKISSGWQLNAKAAEEALVDCFAHGLQTEGLLSLPQELLRSDFLTEANKRCRGLSGGKVMRLRQLVSADDFSGDIDGFIRYILKHLSMLSPIKIDYYAPRSEGCIPSEHPMLILKDSYALYRLDTPDAAKTMFTVESRSRAVVEKLYEAALSDFFVLSPQIERLDLYDKLAYSFAVEDNTRYIMPYMGPVRLDERILDEFLEKYLDAPHMYEFHRKLHHMTQTKKTSLVTYDSTFIDYINTGRIRLFDGVVTVSREDRRRHLMCLLEEMEENSKTSVLILNERNPILARADNLLTIYMNDSATFAVSDAPDARAELFNFADPMLKRQVELFFTHIEALPENYIKRGQAAADFLSNAIRLI